MAGIALRGLRVAHGERTILADVDLDVRDGEVVVLLGRSGAGKTSLLRVIAGLDDAADGRVLIGGVDVTAAQPRDRGIGMVAQGSPLVPTMTVEGNVAFPLEVRHLDREERERRTLAELRAFGLERLRRRRPRTLSAGQQQATATARALVSLPRTLLLDEPIGHLDEHQRRDVLAQLRTLQDGAGITMLVTTNDHLTARVLAHRVAVIGAGTVAQAGPLDEVAAAPASLDVADLVWSMPPRRLPATVEPRPGLPTLLHTAAGTLSTWTPAVARLREVVVAADPERITIAAAGARRDLGLRGTVQRVAPMGARDLVVVALPTGRLELTAPRGTVRRDDEVVLDVGRAAVAAPDGRVVATI